MGVRHTETSLIVWTGSSAQAAAEAGKTEAAIPVFNATRFYDAGDRGCAMGPMDEIAAVILTMQHGETLEIHATDPTVEVDIAAWCRMTGHQLTDQQDTHYLVQHK